MLQRFIVSPVLFQSELSRAFVQLLRHFSGFFSGTAEGDQDGGEGLGIHKISDG